MINKIISILSLIFSFAFSSCENSIDTNNEKIIYDSVLLKVGNDYFYRFSEVDGQDGVYTVVDWYSHKIIIRDTLIDFKKYYINNYGELYSNENNILYLLENSFNKIQLNYNVKVGDTCYFLNNKVIVQNISIGNLFGEKQKTYQVSNVGLLDSILVSGKYCTKFGLLNSSVTSGNSAANQNLMTVKIGKIQYQ